MPGTIYIYLHLPSTLIILIHNTHSHTTTQPPSPKHRHMSHTTPVPTGLVKPKPNPLTHSPSHPTHLTLPLAKHIQISLTLLTPLTPRTTLMTSSALDITHEPVLTIYLISKTHDTNYGYARYCAVIYNGATNQVRIKNQ